MEINLPLQPTSTTTLTASVPEIKHWQVGQILKAVATTQSQNGQVTLQIGSQTVEAKTPVTIQLGQQLTLEVANKGAPPLQPPLLKITNLLQPQASPAIEQGIRQAIPRQNSHTPLLANLTQLTSIVHKDIVPATIVQAIRTFIKILPDAKQASTADGLRQSIRNSGIFLESKLRSPDKISSIEIHQDIKAGLLRLQQNVQSAYRSFVPLPPSTASQGQQTGPPSATPPGPDTTAKQPIGGNARNDLAKAVAASAKDPGLPTRSDPAGKTAPPTATGLRPSLTVGAPVTIGTDTARTQSPGLAGTILTGSTLEQILRSLPMAKELAAPLLRNSNLQAQARAEASVSIQDNLARIFTTLLKDTDSSLARMQLTQLGSQPVEGDQRQVWLLELPIRKEEGIDLFQFRIEREQENRPGVEEQEDGRWTVKFAFALQGLGPVQARVALSGDHINATLWAQEEETVKLFLQHRQTLEQNLARAGLVVEKFSCLMGLPQQDRDLTGHSSEQILNEQA